MNIGVIGTGQRIKRILELLFQENPNHKIISAYDPNQNSIEKFKEKFKEVKFEKSSKEVIKNPKIDWIFIGSINKFHKEQIILSLKYKKNIFCEKPLVIKIKDLIKIKKEYNKNKKKFLISYPLRHSLHYKKIKEIVDSDEIGKIISLEFNEVIPFNHGLFIMGDWRRFYSLSGGHLLEKCCHDFDIINWIINSKIKKIASFGGLNFFKKENSKFYENITNKEKNLLFSGRKLKNAFILNKDIFDNQVVIIEFENGIRGTFHTNCNSQIPERRIYICGTKGTIRSDLLKGEIQLKTNKDEKIKLIKFNKKMRESHGGGDNYLAKEINLAMTTDYDRREDFINAIKSALPPILADKSIKNKKIIFLKKYWKKLNL